MSTPDTAPREKNGFFARNPQFFQKYFICFLLYAMLGWTYEVVLETFIYRWGFSNRGVLFGPYCPVYGVGAMAFLLCLHRLMRKKDVRWLNFIKPIIVFGACMLIATTIELAASYLLEALTGAWPWQTYADYTYNFQARIALSPSLRFGLGGTVFLYLVQPLFDRLLGICSPRVLNRIAACAAAVLVVDCIYTVFWR